MVKHGLLLCFVKLAEIKKVNLDAQNDLSEAQSATGQERFKHLYDNDKCKVKFHLLNMGNLANNIIKRDFKILEVADYDFKICEKDGVRHNVIQISFSELTIIWDLDDNKEVTFMTKPSDFASQRDYVASGFVPHFFTGDTKHMSKTAFFSQNEDRSLVIMPSTKYRRTTLIRTFAEINLMDVLLI